jgi:hypothetical protein
MVYNLFRPRKMAVIRCYLGANTERGAVSECSACRMARPTSRRCINVADRVRTRSKEFVSAGRERCVQAIYV